MINRKVLLFLLIFISFRATAQITWFETNFQALAMVDSLGRPTVLVMHKGISAVVDYCGLRLIEDGNSEIYKYEFIENKDWQVINRDIYQYIDSNVTLIINIRERWVSIDEHRHRMQLYYEIPELFTIRL